MSQTSIKLNGASISQLSMLDRDIADAVRMIREGACCGVTIKEIVKRVGLSRRLFEQRFRKYVGHTPHEEIQRVRLDQAKRLLAETDLKISAIAIRCGFSRPEYISVVFKRYTRQTPAQYRAATRLAAKRGDLWTGTKRKI